MNDTFKEEALDQTNVAQVRMDAARVLVTDTLNEVLRPFVGEPVTQSTYTAILEAVRAEMRVLFGTLQLSDTSLSEHSEGMTVHYWTTRSPHQKNTHQRVIVHTREDGKHRLEHVETG